MSRPVVAKVGGSLFDLPDLGDRLRTWLSGHCDRQVVLVPGGGASADQVRRLDRIHQLGESTAHWLALRVLSVNAHFLAGVLGGLPVIPSVNSGLSRLAVLDPFAFCHDDDCKAGSVEHSWRVTSDSVAARAAAISGGGGGGAGDLVLLKSTDRPVGSSWEESRRAGLVDEAFPDLVHGWALRVTWVNLRGTEFSPRR